MDEAQRERLRAELEQEQVDAFGVSDALARHFLRFDGGEDRAGAFAERYGTEALLCALARELWHVLYGEGHQVLDEPERSLPIARCAELLEASPLGKTPEGAAMARHLRALLGPRPEGGWETLAPGFSNLARDFEAALDRWAEETFGLKQATLLPGERFEVARGLVRVDADAARTIRVPIHLAMSFERLGELRAQLGREPTVAEFAEATGRDPEAAEPVLSQLQAFKP